MNPNSPYDSNSLSTSNVTNSNVNISTGDGNTSKNVNCIRTGGPQQPGVYALPASVATTVNLSSGSNPGVVTTGKVNTFASVVAGGIKDESEFPIVCVHMCTRLSHYFMLLIIYKI